MLENLSIKEAFDQIATEGVLGDPLGELAYSYIRVSRAQQAEDGRTGLPRQIQHCHEVAREKHFKTPGNWSSPMIYQGTVNTTTIRVAEVFRPGIMDNATGLIVCPYSTIRVSRTQSQRYPSD